MPRRSRKRVPAHRENLGKLNVQSAGMGNTRGMLSSIDSHLSAANTPAIATIPTSHLMAGVTVPVGEDVKAKMWAHKNPLDLDFVNSLDQLTAFFEYALKNEYLSPTDVEAAISIRPLGRLEQVNACAELVHKALTKHVDRRHLSALLSRLDVAGTGLDFVDTDTPWYQTSSEWEFDFTLGLDMWSDSYDEDEYGLSGLELVSRSWGLTVIDQDVLSLDIPSAVKNSILQLIFFCARISGHATAVDLFTDDYIQLLVTGDESDEYYSDLSEEEFDEDHLEYIKKYRKSVAMAIKMHKRFDHTASKTGLSRLNDEILSLGDDAPKWLLDASSVLLDGYIEGVDFFEYTGSYGGFPFAYSRPVGIGIPFEHDVYSQLNEMIACGEEHIQLLALDEKTRSLLTNIDLAENLLLFINEMISNNGR